MAGKPAKKKPFRPTHKHCVIWIQGEIPGSVAFACAHCPAKLGGIDMRETTDQEMIDAMVADSRAAHSRLCCQRMFARTG